MTSRCYERDPAPNSDPRRQLPNRQHPRQIVQNECRRRSNPARAGRSKGNLRAHIGPGRERHRRRGHPVCRCGQRSRREAPPKACSIQRSAYRRSAQEPEDSQVSPPVCRIPDGVHGAAPPRPPPTLLPERSHRIPESQKEFLVNSSNHPEYAHPVFAFKIPRWHKSSLRELHCRELDAS